VAAQVVASQAVLSSTELVQANDAQHKNETSDFSTLNLVKTLLYCSCILNSGVDC
jgi:hypothetical protein